MKVAIIGAGPAGLMCAIKSSENKNNQVIIFDRNEKIGKKMFITGKGRCNVCNNTSIPEFLENVVSNNKFLYASINNFSPQNTIDFFNSNGTPLKTERGNRVFPVSDKSSDIIKTFSRLIKKDNIELRLNSLVNNINLCNDKFIVKYNNQKELFDIVVVATGGKSYSSTGSKGDGLKFATQLGHTIIPIEPALVPIKLKNYDGSLSGLSLKNVELSIQINNKMFSQFGEMLFTHTGISGPIVLTLSSYINKFDIRNKILKLDLKPALSEEKLEERLMRDFHNNKIILKNYLKELLPTSLINFFISYSKLPQNDMVCNLNKEIRKKIIYDLKNLEFVIDRLEDIEFAIISSGGIDTKEINPKTMESKIIKNLYFAGEVIDVDALTGGFNMQIAMSTGFLAGNNISLNK